MIPVRKFSPRRPTPMTLTFPGLPRLTRPLPRMAPPLLWFASLALAGASHAMGLQVEASSAQCGAPAPTLPAPPAAAQGRLPQSQVVQGQKDILWAWLGSPTARYPHAALGSTVHAASLHVLVSGVSGAPHEVVYHLPLHRVFEDRVPRLADLDADGRDEIILVEADILRGAAVVVLGLHANPQSGAATKAAFSLHEVARSPYAGATFRWLNPVGVADFDGDGKPDIASVTTPHVGGVLTLYHFRPPRLEAYAKAMDVSNHRMGALEQQLAVTVHRPGSRPTIVVPDMQLGALHALRWDAPGQWTELADPKPLPARVERLTPLAGGACLLLTDASWWRVTLVH